MIIVCSIYSKLFVYDFELNKKNTMKKRSNILLMGIISGAILFALPISLHAQPKTTDITGITKVEFSLACEVTLLQGDKASLVINGDEDALEDVHVKVSGEKLEVYNKSHHQHKDDVEITITIPDLKKLSLSGVVDIKTPEMVRFDNLKVEVSGVAVIDFSIKSKALELEASGVLTAEITGETTNLIIEISGVGKLDASELQSENCEVEVSGVAKASVNVNEKLDASVSGMGRISYKGRPVINKSSSGFGTISRL